jgi:hypothetical protein
MFSIHTASTGPSNKYHFLSEVELALPSRIIEERIPSVLQGEKMKINKSVVRYGVVWYGMV